MQSIFFFFFSSSIVITLPKSITEDIHKGKKQLIKILSDEELYDVVKKQTLLYFHIALIITEVMQEMSK